MKPARRDYGDQEPLLPPSSSETGFYNDGKRPVRDVAWAVAFILSSLATIGLGVLLWFTGDKDFLRHIDPDYLSNPASCPVGGNPMRQLLGQDADGPSANLHSLAKHPVSAVAGTLGGSIALGFLFALGFRHNAKTMINMAVALQISIPLTIGIMLLIQGVLWGGVAMFALAAMYIWLFAVWRQQIELVGRLLTISGHALAENLGVLVLSLALPVVWGVVLIPSGLFTFGAYTNGVVVPNPERYGPPVPSPDDGHLMCRDEDGNAIMCCSWQVQPGAWAYITLLGVVLTWTSMLLSQIRLFTVSGAVGQWYFRPVVIAEGGVTAVRQQRGSRTMKSLGHALGPSFGSLCAAAAVLTVISYLRQALDMCEQQMNNRDNKLLAFVCTILAFILRVILAAVEFLTRFTTVRMAVTGERFVDAAHGAVNLLKRNAMDAFGIWWLPGFVLQNCALMVSVAFGFAVWGVSSLVYNNRSDAGDMSAPLLGVAAGLVALLVVTFFSGLLIDILSAVFFCFALDRDTARATREEVHVVLKEVPGVGTGPVIQQPDGGVAYGQPSQV